jgi:uncharacterized protein
VSATRTITQLYRYPVKGLSPEALDSVALEAGQGFPSDRRYAITNGSWSVDAASYSPRPKTDFLMLMQDERLATLHSRVDEVARCLTVEGPDGERIEASLDDQAQLQAVAAFVGRHASKALAGPPQFVALPGQRFTDVSVVSPAAMHAVSLVNLASVRALEQVIGKPVDPLRFRANIYFDGGLPWEEFDWLDRGIRLGSLEARVVMRTRRCAAVNVDPRTGARDLRLPQTLMTHFRHGDVGVYAELRSTGTLRAGETLSCDSE